MRIYNQDKIYFLRKDYKKTIVITYSKDAMEKKVFDLLKKLYIKNKYIPY